MSVDQSIVRHRRSSLPTIPGSRYAFFLFFFTIASLIHAPWFVHAEELTNGKINRAEETKPLIIGADYLPEGTMLLDPPSSLWSDHPWETIGVLVVVLSLLLLISLLLVQRHRRERAEEELRLSNETLERRVADRTAQLRENEKRLNRAQEIAHLGSWELDLLSNELTWSDEVYRIFGLAPQEFAATYEAFLEHVHPDDRGAVNEAYSGSIAAGNDIYEIEHRVVRSSSGEIRFVHEKCQHVRDEDGRIVRSVGMVLDVTERRNTEEELRRLAHFPDENPNPILRCTAAGTIIYTNRPADQWLATFDRQAGDAGPLPESARETLTEACRYNHAIDAEITNPAGRIFGITAVQPPGEVYVNLYAIDLTDRKKAQEALERSNLELEQFAYVASHDLQEPLRAIVGFLQLLQSRYQDKVDDRGKHYIERSVRAAHHMQTLIRELLTLSRVHTKGSTFLPTDLNDIVRSVLENLQTTIQEKNAQVTCGILPTLGVDASQIRSLFQNLVLNALRYNESPRPLIDIGFEQLDDGYRFQVQDNGIGILPQFHQRIFIVFQRLHTDREYPGTGLGLALCKKIIERHGGTIWVESNPSGGSIFYFTLPKEMRLS